LNTWPGKASNLEKVPTVRKRTIIALVSMLGISVLAAGELSPSSATTAAAPIRLSPDVAEVAELAQHGVQQQVIRAFIQNTPRKYELSANDIVNLRKLHVPDAVITAMLNHDLVLGPAGLNFTDTRFQGESNPGSVTAAPVSPAPGAPNAAAPSVSASNSPPAVRSAPLASARPLRSRSMIVDEPPPGPRLELVPVCPGSDYCWIRGHWSRSMGVWKWIPGAWVHRPGPGAFWINGQWARHGRNWIWLEGYWR
jgi:WXXGXW repeat (2 copies)